jgi:hypothetical protein
MEKSKVPIPKEIISCPLGVKWGYMTIYYFILHSNDHQPVKTQTQKPSEPPRSHVLQELQKYRTKKKSGKESSVCIQAFFSSLLLMVIDIMIHFLFYFSHSILKDSEFPIKK